MSTPTRTRIKMCGFTREADVDAAVQAGADAIVAGLRDRACVAIPRPAYCPPLPTPTPAPAPSPSLAPSPSPSVTP